MTPRHLKLVHFTIPIRPFVLPLMFSVEFLTISMAFSSVLMATILIETLEDRPNLFWRSFGQN